MLHDLEWMSSGKPWPPEDVDLSARLQEHKENREVYDGDHEKVFGQYQKFLNETSREERRLPIILDWAPNGAGKTFSLLLGETPDVEIEGAEEALQEELIDPLLSSLEEAIEDCYRYGVGLLEVFQDGGRVSIQAINPEGWIPITSPGSARTITEHVLFWTFKREKREYIKFTIHRPGSIQHRIFELRAGKLEKEYDLKAVKGFEALALEVDEDGLQETDLEEPLIIVLQNKRSSNRYYGRSELSRGVKSVLEGLEIAFSRRDLILSTHSQPTPVATRDACTFDHRKGAWVLKLGEPILVKTPEASAAVKMLVWNAELAELTNHIHELMDQLLYMLDLSRILLAGQDSGGVASGEALMIRLIPTLSKVRRYRSICNRAIPDALRIMSGLGVSLKVKGAAEISKDSVIIGWKDGIPQDDRETAEVTAIWYGAGLMSLRAALRSRGLTGAALEAERLEILKDRAESASLQPPPLEEGDLEPPDLGGEV